MTTKSNSYSFALIFCSALAAFGPFVTDFYLPALPSMTSALSAGASLVQLSLTVTLIGMGLGQLIIGPLSDKFGRRNPLVIALLFFALSSAGCALSPNIKALIACRFVQGFSAAGGVVMSRSIAADLYGGKRLAKVLAVVSAIMGIAPVVAPIAGGLVLKFASWRGIFVVICFLGLCVLAASFVYRESLTKERRQGGAIISRFAYYGTMARNRSFVFYVLTLAFGFGGLFFTYISASPFIFQDVYKLSAQAFSGLFAINSVAMFTGPQLSRLFKRSESAVLLSSAITPLVAIIIAILLHFHAPFWAVAAAFFVLLMFLNMLNPAATALALNLESKNSGNASAFIGFLEFVAGGAASPLMGIGDVTITCSISLVVCTLLTFLFAHLAVTKRHDSI
jgi:DHA1 family bicyclomycin/chloramphenicol resistance-like MFS transporter